MSNGQNPLVLMMALSLPGAAHALGLGDIHVDSKLNEPLAAQIDIVGASAEELAALSAAVASRETFVRYGADRPAFLSSTTFEVTHDSLGHPVLAVRSDESFTEPVVNFLVDVRWHNGELVREYTLLLDPAVFAPAGHAADTASAPAVQAAPAGQAASAIQPATIAQATSVTQAAAVIQPAPVAQARSAVQAAPVTQATATLARKGDSRTTSHEPSSAKPGGRKMTHYKVGAKGTLRGIAWRVGARSESDLQRLMIAIFRANPAAFEGNINRLRRGALLSIPGTAAVSAISAAEAHREIRSQMAAWHATGKTIAARAAASPAVLPEARPAPIAADTPSETAADAADPQALNRRVQSLEQELHDMQRLLENEHAKLLGVELQVERAGKSAPAVASRSPHVSGSTLFGSVVGLGMLGGALAALYFWVRRRWSISTHSRSAHPAVEDAPLRTGADGSTEEPVQGEMQGAGQIEVQDSASAAAESTEDDATMPLPVIRGDDEPMHTEVAATVAHSAGAQASPSLGADDPTVTLPANAMNPPVDTASLRVDAENLDFNLFDLDMTAQHVQMPSVLHEHVVVKERRTNVVDVLRAALAREPDRHDLRLKLLELYYAAAATNRQGFLEVVQRLAREREYLSEGEWDKIAFMGRQIAAENPLFAEAAADDELADCA